MIAWFGIYLVGVMFFTAHAVEWSRELAAGVTGHRLPGWWADLMLSVLIVLWPVTLSAGIVLTTRKRTNG